MCASTASEGTKRLVEITDEGRRYVADNQAALDSAMSRMAMAARAASGEMPPEDVQSCDAHIEGRMSFHRTGWDCRRDRAGPQEVIEEAAAAISKGSGHE